MTARRPRRPPTSPAAPERLQKLLAAAGLGSRREVEGWIAAGRVTLDGRVARLGERALASQRIELDGAPLKLRAPAAAPPRVLAYHKPVGELVTRRDPQGRPTVFARLPPLGGARWIPVGRLDANTSGLLLVTDSGEAAHRLMHPRFAVEREYRVRVLGALGPAQLERLRGGVELDGARAAFDRLAAEDPRPGGSANRWYTAVLHEGRNREVRRLFDAVGARVSRLVRVRYGAVALPRDLRPGQWRELGPAEVARLLFAG